MGDQKGTGNADKKHTWVKKIILQKVLKTEGAIGSLTRRKVMLHFAASLIKKRVYLKTVV